MRIELIVQGGLGNQLFILLEACRLRLQGKTVHLNICEYLKNTREDRPFLLNIVIKKEANIFPISSGFFAHIAYFALRFFRKFSKGEQLGFRLPGDSVYNVGFGGIHVISSYFQCQSESELDINALESLKKIINIRPNRIVNILAIHIRRGDYLLKKHQMHGVIALKDLVEEAKFALSQHSYNGIRIFTDSPEVLKLEQFYSLGLPVILDEGGDPVKVMQRMSECAGIIASNSSFSLWAGILGAPLFFSVPKWWMPDIPSSSIGFSNIRRYVCTL